MVSLIVVPYAKVETALAQAKDEFREQRLHNTTFHTREEIEAALPDILHLAPEEQPWILLDPWLDLIMASRRLDNKDVHVISLPGKFLVLLFNVSSIGIRLGKISEDDAEDLEVTFPTATTRGDSIEDLIKNQRYFVRLDTCSLKDALLGSGPLKDTKDMWMRLTTSERGMRGISDLRQASIPIQMNLFPWDDTLRIELEYRVYCPPPAGKIAAISQYQWHSPWYHFREEQNHQDIAQRLLESCEKLHQSIINHPSMTVSLKVRGFTFDVVEDPADQKVRLVELNDFGAMSGCDACLFHWINDAKVLYGMSEEVEFRVTVP
ncbi:hypothetical protein ACLMJK_007631 [Lecanora helva]